MRDSLIKKSFSIILAVVMIFTMVPAAVFAANSDGPEMMQFTAGSSGDFHAGAYYNKVYSITFLDSIDTAAMSGALASWDISADAGSGEVMAWMYRNDEASQAANADRYDVYIAGEGGVWAHPQSSYMFYLFSSLEKINGAENFRTENVETFYNAFYGCTSLKRVDFSSWDVSNVTNLSQMFCRCYALEYADLSGWNTEKVTNMKGVFDMSPPSGTSPEYSLKNVDLSGWNTSNVTTMENMFRNCVTLLSLDLSSFNTAKVTTMRFMFYYCKSLKYIYVAEGWTTEAVTNINDGVFNCCYALVGGTDDTERNIEIYNEKHPSAYYPPAIEYAKTKENGGYLTDVSHKPELEPKEYTVTYEFIGSSVPPDVTSPEAEVYLEGSTASVEENPETAEKYIFSGWTTDDAEVAADGSFTVNSDVHFVGSWEKLYKVEYKYAEGFTVPEGAPELPEAVYYKAGEDIDKLGVPYVDRHIFIGWTTEDAVVFGDMFTMPENDVVFYGYFKIPVESIEIMTEDLVLNEKEAASINVYVKPEDATIKDIVYSSDNEAVVKIDKYNRIVAVGEGTATVTVASADDPTKSDTITVTVKIPVTEIGVDKTEITLRTDGEDKITATVNPEATNKEVTYESSDESVVKVDGNGNVEAVGEGTATITVASKDDPSQKVTVTVTVKNPATEITVTADEIAIPAGKEANLGAKVNEDATNKELIYESEDAGVVKVDNDGNIVAVGEGTATVTITSADNPEIKKTVTVTVFMHKVTYEIVGEVRPSGAKAPEGGKYADGAAAEVEAGLYAYGYTFSGWSTDDAEVKDGAFTVYNDVHFIGSFAEIKPSSITVDKTKLELTPDGKDKLTVTVNPENALDKEVIFESGDYRVVTVDKYGNVEAVGEGETVITVSSKSDPSVKIEIPVKVEKPYTPVNGITVNKVNFELAPEEKDKITVTVRPDDATDKEVLFESSDESVVKVDGEGNIEAVGEGTATVTVTSKDNPNLSIEVTVKVEKPVVPVTGIVTDKTEIELEPEGKDKLTVTVSPDGATDKTVTFTSSDESVVKVDKDGNIEAVGEGTATVTVASTAYPDIKTTVTVTVKGEEPEEPDVPDVPDVPDEPEEPEYTVTVPGSLTITQGKTEKLNISITPDDGKIKPVYTSSDESIVRVDADGTVTAVGAGSATISVDLGGGDIRLIPVTVTAPVKRTHYVCFGKTDGIGWYEVSVNGGDFFLQGPNSTLEVEEGSVLVVRVKDVALYEQFDFYVNGTRVESDDENAMTVVVDGYMLIGALSMEIPVPDTEESLTFLEKIAKFFSDIFDWFKNLFKR